MVEERESFVPDLGESSDPLELEQSILESFVTLQAKMG